MIGFFELPIKQIFDTELMTMETQSFPLKSYTEPLDRASIVLRLSLNVKEFFDIKNYLRIL